VGVLREKIKRFFGGHMIEFCAGCSEKHDDFRWLKNEEGWFCSKWYRRTGIKNAV
jgi:hypothetical protein